MRELTARGGAGSSGNRLRSGTSLSPTSFTLPTSLVVGACTAWPRTATQRQGVGTQRKAAGERLHRRRRRRGWRTGRPGRPSAWRIVVPVACSHRSGGPGGRRSAPGGRPGGARRRAPAGRSQRSPACQLRALEAGEGQCARAARRSRLGSAEGSGLGASGRSPTTHQGCQRAGRALAGPDKPETGGTRQSGSRQCSRRHRCPDRVSRCMAAIPDHPNSICNQGSAIAAPGQGALSAPAP